MKRIVLFTLLLGKFSFAQNVMTPELLWKIGRVSGVQLSNDGKWILYGVTNYDVDANKGNRDLYVVEINGTNSKKITSFKGSEFNEYWGKDGKSILFLSAESGSLQVWSCNVDGTNAIKLTEVPNGINSFLPLPDFSGIVYTADVKLDKSVNEKHPDLPKANAFATDDLMYRHWDQWHDYAYSHVFYMPFNSTALDIMKGERYDSPLNPTGGIEQITIDPSGKTIYYTSKKMTGINYATSTNSDIYAYTIATGETKNLIDVKNGYDINPTISNNGKFLAWLSMDSDGNEAAKYNLVIKDISSGEIINYTEKFDNTVSTIMWSKDDKYIYFISPFQGTEQIFELSVNSKKIRQVTKIEHDYLSLSMYGNYLVAAKQHMNMPTEIFKIDIISGKEIQLTNTNKEIYSKLKIGKIEKRWITTSDNKKMLTWVIYPPNFDATKKYATLLYCQGGPQSTVSQFFSYRWNFQLMAAKGYIVVAPNRRGLPSFGQEWNDKISKDWGGQAIDDYLSAIDSVAKEKYVDKDHLGAVGASYGGYSVYYLAGKHNGRFKSFVSHCGLFNLESWYGTTEELWFANWDIGGNYWQKNKPKSYESFSPHKFVQNWNTPILVIHGEKDFRVPYSQGMEAFSAARMQGVPARFLCFPNENHWVLSPQNCILWHREIFEWLDKYLK